MKSKPIVSGMSLRSNERTQSKIENEH